MSSDKRKHRGGDGEDADFGGFRGDPKKELIRKIATGGSLLIPLVGWLFMMHNNLGELERDIERRFAEHDRIIGELRANMRSLDRDIRRVSQDIEAKLDVIGSAIGDRYNQLESKIHGEATKRGTADANHLQQFATMTSDIRQFEATMQRIERQQDYARFPGYGQGSVPMRTQELK